MAVTRTPVGPAGRLPVLPAAGHWLTMARRRARIASVRLGNGHELQTLAGPVQMTTVDRASSRIGVAEDADGWYAAAEVSPDQAAGPPPLAVLARVFQEAEAADRDPSAVQLVEHFVGAPAAWLGESPAVTSYRSLVAAPPPAHRFRWVCVRVDAYDGAAVAARYGDPAAPARAAAAAILRAGRVLRAAGSPARVLGEAELAAVLRLTGLAVPGRGVREDWHGVRQPQGRAAGPLAQVGFHARGLPAPFVAAAASLPGATAVTLGTTVTLAGAEPRVRHLVRLGAPGRVLGDCRAALVQAAGPAGVGLAALNGRHAPAVYAAGPTASAPAPAGGFATVAAASGADPLAVPWQSLARVAAPPVAAPVRAGLVLGRATDQRVAVVQLFGPFPNEVAVVGGRGLAARVFAARAVALGARVYVRTAYPQDWAALMVATGGRLRIGEQMVEVAGPVEPALIVDEGAGHESGAGTGRAVVRREWQTRLTVLRTVPGGAAVARAAGVRLAALHRLGPDEAAAVAGPLSLAPGAVPAVTRLPDEVVALVGDGETSYTWLAPTAWERTVCRGAGPA